MIIINRKIIKIENISKNFKWITDNALFNKASIVSYYLF